MKQKERKNQLNTLTHKIFRKKTKLTSKITYNLQCLSSSCEHKDVGILPCQVSKLRVDGAGHHLCIDGMELMHTVAESNYLSGTDKCAEKDRTFLSHENMLQVCKNPSSAHVVCLECALQALLTSPGGKRKTQGICPCSLTASAPWIHCRLLLFPPSLVQALKLKQEKLDTDWWVKCKISNFAS